MCTAQEYSNANASIESTGVSPSGSTTDTFDSHITQLDYESRMLLLYCQTQQKLLHTYVHMHQHNTDIKSTVRRQPTHQNDQLDEACHLHYIIMFKYMYISLLHGSIIITCRKTWYYMYYNLQFYVYPK